MKNLVSRKKAVALLFMAAALVLSGIAWAQGSSSSGVSISSGGVNGKLATVIAASSSDQFLRFGDYADGDPKYSSPEWLHIRGTLQDIQEPGDLFYIDTTGYLGDVAVYLDLTNTPSLNKSLNNWLLHLNWYKLISAVNQRIGTGSGGNKYFYAASLPIVPNSETVYVAGVAQTRLVDYTIDYAKGSIRFKQAPANQAAVTTTYQYWAQAVWNDAYRTVSSEAVGTGNGSLQNFALENDSVIPDSEAVYVNGVRQNRSASADYQMDYDNGVIKFNSSSKPASGAAINASYQYFTEAAFRGDSTRVPDEAVATGDGVSKHFDLANASVVYGSETIRVDGVPKRKDIDYTINYDHGDLTFDSAPANGASITASYRYYTVQEIGAHTKGPGKLLGRTLASNMFVLEGDTKYTLVVVDAVFHQILNAPQKQQDPPQFQVDVRAAGGRAAGS